MILLINKPYRLAFLDSIANYISIEEYSQLLSMAFVNSENPNGDVKMTKNKLLRMFKRANKPDLMTAEENTKFNNLENIITVYRGLNSYNKQNIKAMSWTLDPIIAKRFAERYGSGGIIYSAQIEKDNVFALKLERNESEIILDPTFLSNIQLYMAPVDESESEIL